MSSKEEARIFVGGLSWDTTERHLESTFSRFGKVLDVQIMVERDTGRPRGFGFVTFSDDRAVETAIDEMHGRELDGRLISVNKAEPKVASDGPGYGYGGGGGYSSGSRGGGYGGDRQPPVGRSECFKCGRPGHWARDCTAAGGGGSRVSSRSRYSPGGGGGGGGRGDRFGGSDRYSDRYDDDRYDGGRYGDRDRYDGGRYGDRERTDSRDTRYSGGRDRYGSDRYAPSDRYGGPDRYPQNGYSKDRGYDRDGPARGGGDRYGSGGPARYAGGGGGGSGGGGGGYRERPGPYDRPSRGGRGSSYDDRY